MKSLLIKYSLTFILVFFQSIQVVYCSDIEVLSAISLSNELENLDTRLNEKYSTLIKILTSQDKLKLKVEQRNWLKERNKIGSKKNSIPELKKLYEDRVTYLSEQYEKVAKPIIEQLLTDEENIDEEEKLQVIKNCDLNMCKAYKFYFQLDVIDYSTEKSLEYKNALSKFAAEISNYTVSSYLEEFNMNTISKTTALNLILSIISSAELYDDIKYLLEDSNCIKSPVIPLWLVKKNPEILENLWERFSPTVIAKNSIHTLPKFSKLTDLIYNMEEGRWVTTSYITHRGTIFRDINSARYNIINIISFAPWLHIPEISIEDKLKPLRAWSFEGIWNRRKFIEFMDTYKDVIEEFKHYYTTNYDLKDYADKAEDILASYIHYCMSHTASYAQNNGYKLFSESNISLSDLKIKSQGFNQDDWNISLPIAILNHYPKSVIEWIIKSGADVNNILEYEVPLMKAVEQPEIVNLLLEHGADSNIATPYGKTALFYAVQYNNLESVKSLIAYKGRINQKIKSLKELEELGEEQQFLLELIAGYTPLIYSLRYASKDIIEFLTKNGANVGELKIEDFKSWVLGNEHIDKDQLNAILDSIRTK